jgi:Tfp pilus assembly protein PilO
MSRSFIALVCFSLTALFGPLMLLPRYQELKGLKFQVLEKERELSQGEQYVEGLKSLNEKLAGYSEEMLRIESAIPESADLPSLFNFLETACSQSGLLLKGVGSGPAKLSFPEEGDLKEVEADFEAAGTKDALLELLSKIENSARLIKISSISFEQPPEGGDIFSFKLKAKIYYR